MIQVFRVLCGEWVEPLWDCMFLADAATCIPFFLLITFVANFMVFNLFVAILLEAFNVENLSDKGAEQEAKIAVKKTETIKRGIGNFAAMLKEKKKSLRNSIRRKTLPSENSVKVPQTANGNTIVENSHEPVINYLGHKINK